MKRKLTIIAALTGVTLLILLLLAIVGSIELRQENEDDRQQMLEHSHVL